MNLSSHPDFILISYGSEQPYSHGLLLCVLGFLYHFRAKQRKDIRFEEARGDWYTDRKHWRSKDRDSNRDKGEKYNYKVSYDERHYRERH